MFDGLGIIIIRSRHRELRRKTPLLQPDYNAEQLESMIRKIWRWCDEGRGVFRVGEEIEGAALDSECVARLLPYFQPPMSGPKYPFSGIGSRRHAVPSQPS